MEIKNTVGAQFKSMKLLHAALCVGVIIILTVMRYLVKQDSSTTPNSATNVLQIIGATIGFIGVLGSRMLFFLKTKTALSQPALVEKINIYRTGLIIQMAILEGASIINAIIYFITKNDIHFFIALGLLLFMIFGRPTRMMAGMLLFNNKEDKQQIYNDNLSL